METANFPLISIVIISFNQAGYLEPGALHKVGRYFLEHPETDVLSGAAVYVHENQPDLNYIKRCSVDDLDVLPALNNLVQPSCYFRRSLLQGKRRSGWTCTIRWIGNCGANGPASRALSKTLRPTVLSSLSGPHVLHLRCGF